VQFNIVFNWIECLNLFGTGILQYHNFHKKFIIRMGIGSGGQQGPGFVRGTDKAEGGLKVLFFGLVFSVGPFPLEIFLPTPLMIRHTNGYDVYIKKRPSA